MVVLPIDTQRWCEGFRDGYASRPSGSTPDDVYGSYAAGRSEGDMLRLKHQQEYDTMLFSGSQARPTPKDQSDD